MPPDTGLEMLNKLCSVICTLLSIYTYGINKNDMVQYP